VRLQQASIERPAPANSDSWQLFTPNERTNSARAYPKRLRSLAYRHEFHLHQLYRWRYGCVKG